jgi:hypothetical protein
VTIAVDDPGGTAARWGELLGVEPRGELIELDDSYVRFEQAAVERLTEVHAEVPGRDETVAIGGASFRLTPPS